MATRADGGAAIGARPFVHGLEALKWLAVAGMTLDHAGRLVLGLDSPAGLLAIALGNVGFPLFAWVLAARLAEKPARWRRYLARLVPAALLAQPCYAVALGGVAPDALLDPLGFLRAVYLDSRYGIFVTLGLGVAISALLHGAGSVRTPRVALPAVALPAVALPAVALSSLVLGAVATLGPQATYGLAGVMLVPVLSLCLAWRHGAALAALPLLALAANYPWIHLALPAAVLLVPLVVMSGYLRGRWPRAPGWFFYAYYPGHLLVLLVLGAATGA